jgi:hypothetical protein
VNSADKATAKLKREKQEKVMAIRHQNKTVVILEPLRP